MCVPNDRRWVTGLDLTINLKEFQNYYCENHWLYNMYIKKYFLPIKDLMIQNVCGFFCSSIHFLYFYMLKIFGLPSSEKFLSMLLLKTHINAWTNSLKKMAYYVLKYAYICNKK